MRPRLIERLNIGLDCKLTLISAPAGFGKSTLVSAWVADIDRNVAWLSLDEGDSNLPRFLSYLIAALQTVNTQVGAGIFTALLSPQPPPVELALTLLLNELASLPDRIILVLDDYHLVDSKPVDQALTFLLEHIPPQLHLVIATREDPDLSLARLRARGELSELRAADLRFSQAEASEFLEKIFGLPLAADETAALETRTEGWIAGLQLAALALQSALASHGPSALSDFVHSFTGSHRYILDYLLQEVLQNQPDHIRTFLLQTAILERLNSSLCQTVTGCENCQDLLENLERDNLFLVALDDQRLWFRYHHLFKEVLQSRLLMEFPNQVSMYHQRASLWFEQNGYPADAIGHALAAGNQSRVADLIELVYPMMDSTFQFTGWMDWVKKLPQELVQTRPVLCVDYAWALTDLGELEESEAWLKNAETGLKQLENQDSMPCPVVIVDEKQFRSLPFRIVQARAYHAQARGDIPNTVRFAQMALDLTPKEDLTNRIAATLQMGIADWSQGKLEPAFKAMDDWIQLNLNSGKVVFAIASTFFLADIQIAQGRLNDAKRTLQEMIYLAETCGQPVDHVSSHLYLGLGLLQLEWNDIESARQYFEKAEAFGNVTTLVDFPYRKCLSQARLKQAEGDLDAALDLLDEAKRVYVRIPVPDTRPIEAMKVRVYLQQERLEEAQKWVQDRNLSEDDDLDFMHEYEHITLARVWLATYQCNHDKNTIESCIRLLDRLLNIARADRRVASELEILVILALAYHAQGEATQAMIALQRALVLAEPQGYKRLFLDEGDRMIRLLKETARRGISRFYVEQLLEDTRKEDRNLFQTNQNLVEPLSERELEVLRLLKSQLSGPEIARELVVSLNTLRTHTKNIFSKLGVNNRRAAVRRAEDLQLI